jgi:hypothetical protein
MATPRHRPMPSPAVTVTELPDHVQRPDDACAVFGAMPELPANDRANPYCTKRKFASD